MRHNIVTGILLILSITNFVLAAPLLAQKKRQTHVYLPNIRKRVTTVLGKRWEEDLAMLGEDYFKMPGKSVDSSGTHSSSGLVPPGPDHESTNVVQPPTPNPASSTMDPSCLPSSSSMQGLSSRGNLFVKCLGLMEEIGPYRGAIGGGDMMFYAPQYAPPEYGQFGQPYTLSATKNPLIHPQADPFDSYYHWSNVKDPPPSATRNPLIHPEADPTFDWHHWLNVKDLPPSSTPTRPTQQKKLEIGEASGYGPGPLPKDTDVEHTGPPGSEFYSFTTAGEELTTEPEHDVVPEPPSNPDLGLHLGHQSSSAPADLTKPATYEQH